MDTRLRPEPCRQALRQLARLRSIAVAGQLAAIATAWGLGVRFPLGALLAGVGAIAALNGVAWARLRSRRPVSIDEVAAHLGGDLAGFTLLLLLAGGAGNPFSTFYVLHAVLLALLLPRAWMLRGLAAIATAYLALGAFFVPMHLADGTPVDAATLAFGRGVALVLTAAFTAWFMARIVTSVRERDRRLAEAAQRADRDEAVLRVGALAAGAAHELATPLATIAVVAGEIGARARSPREREDARTLADQVGACRATLSELLAVARHARVAGGRERLDGFLESIAARCRATRPHARIVVEWACASPADASAEIFAEQGLRQALLALLDNAVDANPHEVRLACARVGDDLRFRVTNAGGAQAVPALEKMGREMHTTKPRGTGLGTVLATRAVERLGGTLGWSGHPGGGLCAEVVLPWNALSLREAA